MPQVIVCMLPSRTWLNGCWLGTTIVAYQCIFNHIRTRNTDGEVPGNSKASGLAIVVPLPTYGTPIFHISSIPSDNLELLSMSQRWPSWHWAHLVVHILCGLINISTHIKQKSHSSILVRLFTMAMALFLVQLHTCVSYVVHNSPCVFRLHFVHNR